MPLRKSSVRLLDLLSTSVNFSSCRGIFRQLSVHLRDILSTSVNFRVATGLSVNFLCIRGTYHRHSMCPWKFRELPSTCCVSAGHSVNFPYVSTILRLIPSTLSPIKGPSVNFLCICGTLHQLPSNFLACSRPSINFLCDRWPFCKLPSTLVHPRHLPSTSIKFLCICGSFHQMFVQK